MSRFFHASSSSSDNGGQSDSDNSSINSDSDTELLKVIEQQKQSTTKYTRNQYSSDSDSDTQKTKVISQFDKILKEINQASRLIINGVQDRDWVSCLSELDKLSTRSSKHTSTFTKHNSSLPKIYIKALVLLEDAIKVALNDKVENKAIQLIQFNIHHSILIHHSFYHYFRLKQKN